MIKTKKELILCECNSLEHQMIFIWFEDDDHKEVYLQVHLVNHDSFLKRLWTGIKYIFGYKSQYGAFDEIILSPDHIEGLKGVIKKLEE